MHARKSIAVTVAPSPLMIPFRYLISPYLLRLHRVYTVYVLSPDRTAYFLCGITAVVKRDYLRALGSPWMPMPALVQHWQVPIRHEADIEAVMSGNLREPNDNFPRLIVTGVIRGLVCALGDSATSLLERALLGGQVCAGQRQGGGVGECTMPNPSRIKRVKTGRENHG